MDDTLTAEQKSRLILTGSPVGEPHFEHEGEDVIRWITGGTLPDAHVTFHPEGEQIEVRCATCKTVLGSLPASWERAEVAQYLITIRLSGHNH
jgi:hypothetical protein